MYGAFALESRRFHYVIYSCRVSECCCLFAQIGGAGELSRVHDMNVWEEEAKMGEERYIATRVEKQVFNVVECSVTVSYIFLCVLMRLEETQFINASSPVRKDREAKWRGRWKFVRSWLFFSIFERMRYNISSVCFSIPEYTTVTHAGDTMTKIWQLKRSQQVRGPGYSADFSVYMCMSVSIHTRAGVDKKIVRGESQNTTWR